MPQLTYSAHWIADAGFRRAVADFLKEEGAYVDSDKRILSEMGPFRKS
jgi:predicted N-acyltransferase